MNIGISIKQLKHTPGKTSEELGLNTLNNWQASPETIKAADQLLTNNLMNLKKYELRNEITKAWNRGYRKAERKNNSYNVGRVQGGSDIKQTIKGFLKGTESCRWLPLMLKELGYKIVKIED